MPWISGVNFKGYIIQQLDTTKYWASALGTPCHWTWPYALVVLTMATGVANLNIPSPLLPGEGEQHFEELILVDDVVRSVILQAMLFVDITDRWIRFVVKLCTGKVWSQILIVGMLYHRLFELKCSLLSSEALGYLWLSATTMLYTHCWIWGSQWKNVGNLLSHILELTVSLLCEWLESPYWVHLQSVLAGSSIIWDNWFTVWPLL